MVFKPVKPQEWAFRFSLQAQEDFQNLDRSIQERIRKKILSLITHQNPRTLGKPLSGKLSSFWSYRIGDWRMICTLEDEKFIILALRIAHRRHVYKT